VEEIAAKLGVTASQIAVGWVVSQSGRGKFAEIIPIPGATTSERIQQNSKPAKLSEEDVAILNDILKKFRPVGDRYHKHGMALTDQ
jgi:pyridoxine 4-dehydrogenase